jgi:hypothetical protein
MVAFVRPAALHASFDWHPSLGLITSLNSGPITGDIFAAFQLFQFDCSCT